MKKIKRNHWYINDNHMSISLLRFYVDIEITTNDIFIILQMTVIDEGQKKLVLDFYTLEDAIYFTEDIITCGSTLEEITSMYQELFSNKNIKTKHK